MDFNANRKDKSLLSRVLSIVLIVACVVGMTVYAREGAAGPLHSVQMGVHAFLAPISSIGVAADNAVERSGVAVSDNSADAETLSELRAKLEEMTKLVTQSEEYRLEVERLQGLLDLKGTYDVNTVTGRVIGRSTDAWNQTITLDVGSDNGVEPGLTVMGATGVIGQVISVLPGSCTVRLLTDPQSGAAAIVQQSRAEGVVRGSLEGLLYLENIAANVPLVIGDVVLTSGLGGSYVKSLLIGTIVRIDGTTGDGLRTIVVSPNSQNSGLEEVAVVLSAKASEAQSGQDANANADANAGAGAGAGANANAGAANQGGN